MRSSKFWLVGISLLAVIFTLGLVSCGGGDDDPKPKKSTVATLASLKLGDVEITLKDPLDGAGYDAAANNLSSVFNSILSEFGPTNAQLKDVTVTALPSNKKAKVEWYASNGRNLTKPEDTAWVTEKVNWDGEGYLLIRVTAEDVTSVNYYAVKVTPMSSDTRLRSIKVGDKDAVNFDSGADTEAEITKFAAIKLTSAEAQASQTFTLATTATDFKGELQIAKVSGTDTPQYEKYTAPKAYSGLSHDDIIYIKVIAVDTAIIQYYGAKIEVGADATLRSVTFDGQEANVLGTPADTLAGVSNDAAGNVLMLTLQTVSGLNVTAAATDSQAEVSFGKATAAESTWTAAAKDLVFTQGEFLGVKVVSQNKQVTNYYKIRVDLLPSMNIGFGKPKVFNTPDQSDKTYVDPLWNSIAWVPIENVNTAETSPNPEFINNGQLVTTAQAKLYWDGDGLYLYVEVKTPHISTQTSDYQHDGSSVELFINEQTNAAGDPQGTTGSNAFANGGQYRLDSNGVVSGDPTAAPAAMTELNKYKTWPITGGYAVMFQAPWRVTGDYPLDDNKKIGLEIQVNAAGSAGTRVGILKWYNTTGNTYQNSTVLAPATLKLNGNVLGAQKPSITTQPTALTQVEKGSTTIPALSVVAVPTDGGTLSYQWYSAANATDTTGTVISGATSASYTPTVSAAEVADFYFFVEITNTKGTTNSIKSNVVKVQVYDPATTPVNIEFVTSSHPNWNAAEGALVFESEAGWGGGVSNTYNEITDALTRFVVPAHVTPALYARVELVFSAFAGTTSVTNNGGQWNQDLGPTFTDGTTSQDWGRNASANPTSTGTPLVITSRWNITDSWAMDFSGGTGYISLNAMNKTNGINSQNNNTLGVGTITKFVIKSVKLVLRNP
jgi:hypothetical protein